MNHLAAELLGNKYLKNTMWPNWTPVYQHPETPSLLCVQLGTDQFVESVQNRLILECEKDMATLQS